MRSFASTVEESFNKAQARAKEINAALMLTTNGAASTVSSQFELIRTMRAEKANAPRPRCKPPTIRPIRSSPGS